MNIQVSARMYLPSGGPINKMKEIKPTSKRVIPGERALESIIILLTLNQ